MRLKIKDLEDLSLKKDFWNDQDKAREVLQKKTKLTDALDQWEKFNNEITDIENLAGIALQEKDEQVLNDLSAELEQLSPAVNQEELKMMLNSEQDAMNAIVSIHAGAGGTEAQDWVEMLLRMYLRWAEKKKFTTKIIDFLPGDEAGVKSVSFTMEGEYAYGYAKAESGIHRLVRISPFDAGARRHTSFASVFVYPEVDDEIKIEINEDDLRIDTFRAGGKGGQHVNKTDSAVRITHLPTGIVVQCQNERSQFQNKAMAMKFLKSRLYERELQLKNEKIDAENKLKKDIAWGSQIRSYVLHPYKMVKDHRTNLENSNASKVLDGDIDEFIQAYLMNTTNHSSIS
ncbi:MAG: peptide chain release factor 2 [Deltaproteobacteria bacterium HGW-Deltaproteobacteria-7]|jgi:peptide chain release factor 2|nr:MAG: peptide chain release factor 2 [Deltaproteobacteria bacterium HGW-Deltaproteobacteria-7]PKN51949.1 MAG: peptide chain release factor 2 [Deltaproteobacteria bacterium HGW-Deltaproteobacteria-13]